MDRMIIEEQAKLGRALELDAEWNEAVAAPASVSFHATTAVEGTGLCG